MSVITLKNVRLSFPQIWTPKAYMEGQTAKYSANFLLDKEADKEQISNFKKEIKKAATVAFNGTFQKVLKPVLATVLRKPTTVMRTPCLLAVAPDSAQ